ncbi:MAG: sensor histidine kinase [Bacteroidaceae bacterium]|nr:sensor histidine kinase [Bacteroidaceae bacterium]
MVNLPIACLFVWVTMQFAVYLERCHVPVQWRYVMEVATIVGLFLMIRWLHLSLLSYFITFPVPLQRVLLPAVVVAVLLVQLIELDLYRDRIRRETEEKINYQQMMLRRQFSPHFLFNSLNVLAALTYKDAAIANRFIKKLSRIYRYILDTQEQVTVPLTDELAFVDNYVYLQHIRFADAVRVEVVQKVPAGNHLTVPGCIQQLVENAIKHNIATAVQPLVIHIEIQAEAITVRNNLQLRPDDVKHGTGLVYLREQFALLGKELVIAQAADAFIVTIPHV